MMEIRRPGFFPAWLLTAVVVATATVQGQEAQAEEPSSGVRGRVIGEDGKPIAGARVSWTERALRFSPLKHEATTEALVF